LFTAAIMGKSKLDTIHTPNFDDREDLPIMGRS
jgi:hypothetical protein